MINLWIVTNSLNVWKIDENSAVIQVGWNFTQVPSSRPHLRDRLHIDLPLSRRKYHGKFADSRYYKDWMHNEQRNILLYIYTRLQMNRVSSRTGSTTKISTWNDILFKTLCKTRYPLSERHVLKQMIVFMNFISIVF